MIVKYKILKSGTPIPGLAPGSTTVAEVLEMNNISSEFIITVDEEPVELEDTLEDLLDGTDVVELILSTKVKNA